MVGNWCRKEGEILINTIDSNAIGSRNLKEKGRKRSIIKSATIRIDTFAIILHFTEK